MDLYPKECLKKHCIISEFIVLGFEQTDQILTKRPGSLCEDFHCAMSSSETIKTFVRAKVANLEILNRAPLLC